MRDHATGSRQKDELSWGRGSPSYRARMAPQIKGGGGEGEAGLEQGFLRNKKNIDNKKKQNKRKPIILCDATSMALQGLCSSQPGSSPCSLSATLTTGA